MKYLIIVLTLLSALTLASQEINSNFGDDGVFVFDSNYESAYGTLLNGGEKAFFINDKFYFVNGQKVIAFDQTGNLDQTFNETGVLDFGSDIFIGNGFSSNEKLHLYGCVRNQNQMDFLLINLEHSNSLQITQEIYPSEPNMQIECFNHMQSEIEDLYVFGRKKPMFGNTPEVNTTASLIAKFGDKLNPSIEENNFFFIEAIDNLVYFQDVNEDEFRLYFLTADFYLNYIDFDLGQIQAYNSDWWSDNLVEIGLAKSSHIQQIIPINDDRSLITWSNSPWSHQLDEISVWNEFDNSLENLTALSSLGNYEINSIQVINDKILISGNKLEEDDIETYSMIMLDKDLNFDLSFGESGVFEIPSFDYELIRTEYKPILKGNALTWLGEGFFFNELNDSIPEITVPLGLESFAIQILLDEASSTNKALVETLKIYPSLTNDGIFISGIEAKELYVHDLSGKLYLQKSNPSDFVDVSLLASGMYFLSVKDNENEIHAKPFFKENY